MVNENLRKLMQTQRLVELMREYKVPDYVTIEQVEEMMTILKDNVRSIKFGMNDMTLELSVEGINLEDARYHLMRAKEPSIYRAIYCELNRMDS